MNTIIVTARYDGDKFDLMLGPSIKNFNTKCVNVSDKEDSKESDKTISNKYNIGIVTALQNGLITDDTIVILCKSDVSISDPNAVAKLEHVFSTKPELGMVGVKGVLKLNDSVDLYHKDNIPVNGIVYNVIDQQRGEYFGTDKKGYFTNVVAVDDSFMAIRGSVLKNIQGLFSLAVNNGFGIDATIKILKSGYDVAVIDLFVISNSYTDIKSEIISDICKLLNLGKSVSVQDLELTKNFIVDVEL